MSGGMYSDEIEEKLHMYIKGITHYKSITSFNSIVLTIIKIIRIIFLPTISTYLPYQMIYQLGFPNFSLP